MKLFTAGAQLAVCVPEFAAADVRRTLIEIIDESKAMESDPETSKHAGKDVGSKAVERQLDGAWHVWT